MDILLISKIQDTVLYTGSIKLFNDLATALVVLSLVITTTLAIWRGIQWQAAEEQEKPSKKKHLIMTIIIGVIVAVSSGLIKVILAYYNVSDATAMLGSALTIFRI